MKCPKCGNARAKDVALLTSISYLCPNTSCSYYDVTFATEQVMSDYEFPDTVWPDNIDLVLEDLPLFVDLADLD